MHPSRSHRLQRHQPPYLLSLLSLLFAHPGRPPHWTCFLWDEPSLSFTCKASLLPSLFLPLAGSSSNPRLSLDLCSFGQASSSPGLSPQWLVVNPGAWGGMLPFSCDPHHQSPGCSPRCCHPSTGPSPQHVLLSNDGFRICSFPAEVPGTGNVRRYQPIQIAVLATVNPIDR